MDKTEARDILAAFMKDLKARPYPDLLALMGNPQVEIVESPSGGQYQIEYESFWDREPGGDLRVLASIDDGGLISVMFPLCADFIVGPGGEILA